DVRHRLQPCWRLPLRALHEPAPEADRHGERGRLEGHLRLRVRERRLAAGEPGGVVGEQPQHPQHALAVHLLTQVQADEGGRRRGGSLDPRLVRAVERDGLPTVQGRTARGRCRGAVGRGAGSQGAVQTDGRGTDAEGTRTERARPQQVAPTRSGRRAVRGGHSSPPWSSCTSSSAPPWSCSWASWSPPPSEAAEPAEPSGSSRSCAPAKSFTVAVRGCSVPSSNSRVTSTWSPGSRGAESSMSMRWFPPGSSTSSSPAGSGKPPSFSCMLMPPEPSEEVSWSSTWALAEVRAPISTRSPSVPLRIVPKAEVIPSSAAFTQGSATVSASSVAAEPPPSEGAP